MLRELLERQGRLDDALAALKEPDEAGDVKAALATGRILVNQGDLAGAETAYRRARDRGSPDAPAILGGILAKREAVAEAIAELQAGDDAGNGLAAYNLGVVLADNDRFDQAREAAFRRALQRGEQAARNSLAAVLFRRGAYSESEGLIRQILELERESQERFMLGLILEQQGDAEAACTEYAQCGLVEDRWGTSLPLIVLCRARDGDFSRLHGPLSDAVPEAAIARRASMMRRVSRSRKPRSDRLSEATVPDP